jgi:hypothetical protein
MGLISILPNNSRLYYSTATSTISVVKYILTSTPIYEGGEHLTREIGTSPTSNIIGLEDTWQYEIQGNFNIWDNESDYNDKKLERAIGHTGVRYYSNTLPEENVYQTVYSKLKEDLSMYETTLQDDI